MALTEIQPPPLGWVSEHTEGDAVQTLDALFAQNLLSLMSDEVSVATAIHRFEKASILAMQQYRESASSLLHRAAHYIHARRIASELESQAASWQLLQHLYCSGYTPAGDSLAGAADAGELPTYREQVAGIVNENADLRRCAQVVCWLESLAAERLQEAPPARFAHHEGLWRETLLTTSAAAGAMELDPDAPSRGKVRLAAGDFKGEERLAAHLWQLIRAGKVREAGQLCCQAGQAWRCLSLAGGGAWGPLPVGEAAAEAAQQVDQQAAADELSWQVEGGIAGAEVAWKWACYAAADAAATAAAGNRWEAAVYGAMCGHVTRMLPVCNSWEDEVWAYCRSWLDLQTDAELLEAVEAGDPAAVTFLMGNQEDDSLVSPDLLLGIVTQAASSGYSKSTDSNNLQEGLTVTAGRWPLQKLLAEGERSIVPRNFQELMHFVHNSSNTSIRSASNDQQHILQLLLMSEDWQSVTMELTAAALTASEQLQQLQQKQEQQQLQLQQADTDMEYEATNTSSMLSDEEGVSEMSADAAAGVLRFAAHWALCLRALGLLQDHTWVEDEEEQEGLARLQNMLGKVVYQYADLLAQQPSTLFLVPIYLCHLKQPSREALLETLLANATDFLDDEVCQDLYAQLLAATEAWHQRQERLSALILDEGQKPGPYWEVEQSEQMGVPRQPSSCLFGDLRDQELRLLLQHLITRGFSTSTTPHLQRCRELRWLFYSFTGALYQQQQQQQQHSQLTAGADALDAVSPALAWQDVWSDALSYTLVLASEMLLNPSIGSAGLQLLLNDVMPDSFTDLVSSAGAAGVSDVSEQLQVQRQLQAIKFWQVYVDLDARYQHWKQDWAAALSGCKTAAARGTAAMLNQLADLGQALVTEMLNLAMADSLRLPAPEQLSQHLATMTAEADDAAAAEAVAPGECMAVPKFDSVDERPTEILMAVTVAAGAADLDAPFMQLQEPAAQQLVAQLNAQLSALPSTAPDVAAETAIADSGGDMAGTLLIRLTSFNDNIADRPASDADGSRLSRRMNRAWQDMVKIAAQLLSSSSRTGDSDDMPRLALVHMTASCSTRLALCRRRTTSKLLRRSGKVLLALARSGHPSSHLDVLVNAAGDAAGHEGPQLLEMLTPTDAGKLLMCLEQIIEEGGLLAEEVEGDEED